MSSFKTCVIPLDPQSCWSLGQQNQIAINQRFFKGHDLKQFYIQGKVGYQGITKIPPAEYPIYEKEYILGFNTYYGVNYVILTRRPAPFAQ